MTAVLSPEIPGVELDNSAFLAYGLDPRDPEPYREMMFYFSDREELFRVRHMAKRLLALRPGDEDGTFMLREIEKIPKWEEILAPVQGITQ